MKKKTITGELALDKIEPNGSERFIVSFRLDGGEPIIATIPPAALESFTQFRRAVAKVAGVWPWWADEDEHPRRQRQLWADQVEDAFRAGGKQHG